MRVFFIKDFDDTKYGGRLHKAGTNAILWETTAIRAITEQRAVPYEERHWVKIEKDEPQAKAETEPQSFGEGKRAGEANERKKKKTITKI